MSDAQPRTTLRLIRDPEPRVIPEVIYEDGTRSNDWADFLAADPDLAGALSAHGDRT